MGYASYLEDIINRLLSEFGGLKEKIENESLIPHEHKMHLRAVIERGQKILNDLLDVATDPDHNHHLAVFNLKSQVESLQTKLEISKGTEERAKKDLAEQLDKYKGELTKRDLEIGKLKKEIDIRRNYEKNVDNSLHEQKPGKR